MAIPEKTQACVSSLTSLRDLASIPQAQRTWAEDQLARLNLWADNLGIFAQGEFSINHRLAKNRQVTRLVEQLVEALSGNIAAYRGAIAREPAQLAEQPSQAGADDDTANSDGDVSYSEMSDEDNGAPDTSELATEVEKSVGRLLQLAIRVRREGARKTAAEAARFEPRDDNGRHLASEFELYIHSICQRAFNTTQDANADARQLHGNERYEVPPFLRQRAEKCMVDRWRRVSYQRHHASNLADPSKRTTAKPETQKPKTKPGAPPSLNRDSGRLQASTAAKDAHVPAATKAVSAATVLSARVKIDQRIDPHPKTAPTVTTKVRADHLEFPRAPKVRDGLDEFKCPICGLLCPTSQLEKKKWQLHVMHDLMPYFCLFEECTQPHLTFQTTEDWSNHAKANHARTSWACQICRSSGSGDRLSTFHHEDDYRRHLERAHGSIAANELSLVIQMSCHKEPPIYSCCVFCGFLPEAHLLDVENDMCQREIISHMAKSHLQPFALDSLPWDVAGGEHADSGRVSGSSATNSKDEHIKQQIMNDPRLGQPEVSELEAETLSDQNGSVQQAVLQGSNVYAASLDEIGRRSSVKDDQSPKDRVGEWCNDQKTMTRNYTITDRDRLLGTEEIATGWAGMNTDAPETISWVEGPQNSALSHMQGGEIPPRLDRKQSMVPPATSGVTSIADDCEEANDNDSESDGTEENVLTHDEKRFLEIAARGDREGLAVFLSNRTKDFDFNCADSKDRNAIHLSLLSPCPSLIDDLVKAGCGVDYWSIDLGTPLYVAVAKENAEAVEALLRHSADVDERNAGQSSALHLACFYQNEGLVRLLLDHSAKIDESVLVTFTEVRALRDSKLDGDGDSDDGESVTSQDSLLDHTFESRTHSIRGTPLVISAFFGDVGITKLLLERGASAEKKATWNEIKGRSVFTATPLLIACRAGTSQVVEVLLAAGADIDQKDNYDDTAATNAVCAESLETLEVLMHHAPCAKDLHTHFARAFKRAARNGHADLVRFFLERGLEPDASDNERTPLMTASFEGQYEVVTMLLEAGASVHETDSDGQSALHDAASGGNAQILELLIKSGSKVDLQDNDQSTPLMVSRDADDPACMRILLDSGANIDTCDDEGTNALAYAASRNRDKHVQVLLERGAQIEATDNDGWTALMYAASWDHLETTELLIEKGADVNHQSGEKLDTPLTLAASRGSIKVAEVLIKRGALLETKNQKGNTALFEACEANEVEVLKLLIGCGCRMDGEDREGDTVLLKTVNAGHIECLQILIEAGATAGPSHQVWELALLLAAEKGNVACLRLLLLKVSPDVTNEDGMTGLMLAVAGGHLECARLLLDANACIDSIDSSGKTALHHVAILDEPECTKLLLARGANHSCRDIDGRTPLLLLAAEEIVDNAKHRVAALVDAGASVNDKDNGGRTALLLAAQKGDVSVLQALCSYNNLDKDAFDTYDDTALIHAATSAAHLRKTEVLIEAGANLHLQDPSNGRNALAYALNLFKFPAAVALMQAGSDLSMVVTVVSSTTLLRVKEGLDYMMTSGYGEDCRDLVKANLRRVVTQLGVLKQARDPVVALTQHQKRRLVKWARSAKQKIRSRRKHKSVSFAAVETPEMMAGAGSQSVSEYSSGSESGSFSESDDGEHLQILESSSNGASSDHS